MKVTKLVVYANCDMATIAWITDEPIKDCRGFALERDIDLETGGALWRTLLLRRS